MSDAVSTGPEITIRAEPSQLDASLCKFTVNRSVHPGGPFFFESAERAAGSPLIERLFQISGVASVLVAGSVVTVGKNTDASWLKLMKPIGGAIRSQLLSGVPTILERAVTASAAGRNDEEIRRAVEELLDREVNPSVASHGGKISVVDVKDKNLYIAMSGGCQGCAASQVTLKQGVEVMVRRVVPEVRAIIDATDHAAGTRPYYQRDS
jgi:Fe-S cluster biogenesis protein NfuA